jgi:hypothetical protein
MFTQSALDPENDRFQDRAEVSMSRRIVQIRTNAPEAPSATLTVVFISRESFPNRFRQYY